MAKKTAAAAAKAAPKTIRITQVRSTIGFDTRQENAMRGLGLRRIRHTVERLDSPETRGLILQVRHLVEVEGE
jgi:large subunit ribosomal protein L30